MTQPDSDSRVFFLVTPAPTYLYTLSLHDALPILSRKPRSSSSNSRCTLSFRNNDRSPLVMFRNKDMSCFLFVTQGHQRIDTRCTPRRDVAREQSYHTENERHGRK